MKRIYILYLISCVLFWASSCNRENEQFVTEETLLASLNALEDISATELEPVNGYPRLFAIDLTLPVDHNDPDGSRFIQRMYLSHTSLEAPMVLHLSGYAGSEEWVIELCNTLRANQILIPHRGYEEALIEPMQWEHLNIEQAAADNHRAVELLQSIYPDEWISTGISKGGMTALFLEYLHPDDAEREITYTHVDLETALELGVMEYGFYLWQYKSGDPYFYQSENISLREMFRRWAWTTFPDYYSDQYRHFGNLFYYQAFNEFGYYDLDDSPVKDLLQETGRDGLKLFFPDGEVPEPDYEKMDRITEWLERNGERIIYLYGGADPWTARQVEPGPGLDALKVVQPGANHGVKIKDCDDKSLIYDKLDEWLEAPVTRL